MGQAQSRGSPVALGEAVFGRGVSKEVLVELGKAARMRKPEEPSFRRTPNIDDYNENNERKWVLGPASPCFFLRDRDHDGAIDFLPGSMRERLGCSDVCQPVSLGIQAVHRIDAESGNFALMFCNLSQILAGVEHDERGTIRDSR